MISNSQTYTIINQASRGDYSLAIRGGKVVIAVSNPRDPYQQWMKRESRQTFEGQRAFSLMNKATNEAIKHEGTSGPVSLVRFALLNDQKSVYWTESENYDKGFRYIRKERNPTHHLTVSGHEMYEGRIVDLSSSDHISERWKFEPYSPDERTTLEMVTISCKTKDGYNLTVRDDTAVLAPADSKDEYQIWIKDSSYAMHAKDEDNIRTFALVNKATRKAIKLGFGPGYLVQLAPFDPNCMDSSLLWTEISKGYGFGEIRAQTNKSAVFQAFYVNELDSNKALLALWPRNDTSDQLRSLQHISMWDASGQFSNFSHSYMWEADSSLYDVKGSQAHIPLED